MNTLILLVGIVVLFFFGAFVSRRRFGELGLALVAGMVLATFWSTELAQLILVNRYNFVFISGTNVVALFILLAPVALLFLGGSARYSKKVKLISSALFALFVGVLVVNVLWSSLEVDGLLKDILAFVVVNKKILITAGVILSLFDLGLFKLPKLKKNN